MHCFSQSIEVAQKWLEEWPNMKFGLVPDYYDVRVATYLSLDHLLLETDAPYFVPKILKAQDNPPLIGVPGNIFHTAAQIAVLRSISIDLVLEASRSNVYKIYGIPIDNSLVSSTTQLQTVNEAKNVNENRRDNVESSNTEINENRIVRDIMAS